MLPFLTSPFHFPHSFPLLSLLFIFLSSCVQFLGYPYRSLHPSFSLLTHIAFSPFPDFCFKCISKSGFFFSLPLFYNEWFYLPLPLFSFSPSFISPFRLFLFLWLGNIHLSFLLLFLFPFLSSTSLIFFLHHSPLIFPFSIPKPLEDCQCLFSALPTLSPLISPSLTLF